ncbi:MAG TPA: hypothetical protein H9896_07335, partial [Candidatus Pygmaiobacter gallistercoris]|nr:hypothetical protein [Candidatus Pygmaiobacter gallistercoris]
PEFWMEKVRRAAPQALVAWGAALSAFYAKSLRQNRCFLILPHLKMECKPLATAGKSYYNKKRATAPGKQAENRKVSK